MKSKKILKIFLIILLLSAGLFWFKFASKKPETVVKEKEYITVTVVNPKIKELEMELSFNGLIVPKENVIVSTELSGIRIKNIFVEVGDEVKKGQKLAGIDSVKIRNDLAKIKAEYDLAKDEFERVTKIKDSSAISKSFYAEKSSRYHNLQAQFQNATADINRSAIVAPAHGVIYERNIETGSLINSDAALFKIVKDKKFELEVEVPEAVISRIKIGTPVKAEISGFDFEINGKVRFVSPNIDNDARTAKSRISLDQNNNFAVGTFGQIKIITDKESGMVIPATSVFSDENGNYVYVVENNGHVKRQDIVIKFRNENEILIEDINGESQIILKAGAFVKEGDVVKAKIENKI